MDSVNYRWFFVVEIYFILTFPEFSWMDFQFHLFHPTIQGLLHLEMPSKTSEKLWKAQNEDGDDREYSISDALKQPSLTLAWAMAIIFLASNCVLIGF
jgi:hypothetical protein